MPDDLDILRSAKVLIDQHGDGAFKAAGRKMERLAFAGDFEGAEAMAKVMMAIATLTTGLDDRVLH